MEGKTHPSDPRRMVVSKCGPPSRLERLEELIGLEKGSDGQSVDQTEGDEEEKDAKRGWRGGQESGGGGGRGGKEGGRPRGWPQVTGAGEGIIQKRGVGIGGISIGDVVTVR